MENERVTRPRSMTIRRLLRCHWWTPVDSRAEHIFDRVLGICLVRVRTPFDDRPRVSSECSMQYFLGLNHLVLSPSFESVREIDHVRDRIVSVVRHGSSEEYSLALRSRV